MSNRAGKAIGGSDLKWTRVYKSENKLSRAVLHSEVNTDTGKFIMKRTASKGNNKYHLSFTPYNDLEGWGAPIDITECEFRSQVDQKVLDLIRGQ